MTTPVGVESFVNDLTIGFMQLAANAGVGYTWRATYDYSDTERGIYDYALAAQMPTDRPCMVVTPWPISHDNALQNDLFGVQFKLFEPGEDWRIIHSAVETVERSLTGRYPVTLPANGTRPRIRVSVLQYSSTAAPARDGQQRRLVASVNFTALVHRPSPYRH